MKKARLPKKLYKSRLRILDAMKNTAETTKRTHPVSSSLYLLIFKYPFNSLFSPYK